MNFKLGNEALTAVSKIFCRVQLHRQEEIYFRIRQVAFYTELFGL